MFSTMVSAAKLFFFFDFSSGAFSYCLVSLIFSSFLFLFSSISFGSAVFVVFSTRSNNDVFSCNSISACFTISGLTFSKI